MVVESEVIPSKDREGFRRFIWRYYRWRGRDFWWRQNPDPYIVFLSEVMLQQTQTERVEKKLREFLQVFPTIYDLAGAELTQVLSLWIGLGYNRRGVNLHKSAQMIVRDYDGIFPSNPQILSRLPGIGAYTSCSIPTFSYNIPTVFVETNIRRVYLYHFTHPDEEGVSDRVVLSLVEQTLDVTNPREWYYALMDYGVELKTLVKNPNQRSRGYKKQSPFEGSLRQIRGSLLRVLTKIGPLTDMQSYSAVQADLGVSFDYPTIIKAARALEKDGILAVNEAPPNGYLWRVAK